MKYFEREKPQSEAVHESKNSEKVVKFISHDLLNDETLNMINNGDLWGLYYDDNGDIVAEEKGLSRIIPALK